MFRPSPTNQEGPSRAFRRARALAIVTVLLAAAFFGYRFLTASDTVQLLVVGNDEPVAGATVLAGGREYVTGADGTVELPVKLPAEIEASAAGFHRAIKTIESDDEARVALSPIIVFGSVTDPTGKGIAGVTVSSGDRVAITALDGSFELGSAQPGTVTVSKHGYGTVEVELLEGERDLEAVIEPFIVKGIRISPASAGDAGKYARLLDMASNSVVNTLVFDTKNEKGAVRYESRVPGAAMRIVYNPEVVLEQAKERGFYTITRIVSFQDAPRAINYPDTALKDKEGNIWRDAAGQAWLDPTNEDAWAYPIALGVEACQLGFDEIQFDYVRFPTDGDIASIDYPEELTEELRVATISAFLARASEVIHGHGCVVSADLFAIVMSTSNDQGIGQTPGAASGVVDAISPMIYPSHYASGWRNLDDPNAHPGIVVGDALATGVPKAIGGGLVRPWLQAFAHTPEQIRESIDAAEAMGLGWMLWSQESNFTPDMLPK